MGAVGVVTPRMQGLVPSRDTVAPAGQGSRVGDSTPVGEAVALSVSFLEEEVEAIGSTAYKVEYERGGRGEGLSREQEISQRRQRDICIHICSATKLNYQYSDSIGHAFRISIKLGTSLSACQYVQEESSPPPSLGP